MSIQNNESMITEVSEALGNSVATPLYAVNTAQTCLMSALIKHLSDKGVIDIDEYLESIKESEKLLLNGFQGVDDEELIKTIVSHTFAEHRKDFEKPE